MEFRKRNLITFSLKTLLSRLLLNVLFDGISARLLLFKKAHFIKPRFFILPKKGACYCSEVPF